MTRADIYKAVSDMIAELDGADTEYIMGLNDMARLLAEQCEEPIRKAQRGPTAKIDLDMGKAKALRDAGWTLKEIADEMGVAPSTISTKAEAGR